MIGRKASETAILAAARVTGVRPEQIRGPSRRADIVAARHVAMWLARRLEPRASLPAIGHAFGGRHHTTVMDAIRKIERATGELAGLREEALRLASGMQCEPERRILLDVDRACGALEALIEDLRRIRDRLRAMADGKTEHAELSAVADEALRWLHLGDRLSSACLGFAQAALEGREAP